MASTYSNFFQNTKILTPHADNIGNHVYHQYTILVEDREKIQKLLSDQKISSAIYYPIPLHKQEVYKKDHGKNSFPVAEFVSNNCLSLPIYPELKYEEIEKISKLIIKSI